MALVLKRAEQSNKIVPIISSSPNQDFLFNLAGVELVITCTGEVY